MKKLFVLLLLTIHFAVFSQNTQTVRGIVTDVDTKMPLPGATVVILNTNPVVGTTTNVDGKFKLENIPVGRVDIKVSFMGYNDQYLKNLEVLYAKELVLTISLTEKVYTMDAVEIVARTDKEKPLNTMASVSARTFSVEETQRYAGSLGDPSRMVQNFAGVMSAGDARNDIIIRGNSPMGLLWRMEGIDIPNPNHFGALGTTGGPVTMLNNNLLTNSDFITGAFPAEYGNALSGVFDLKMRNGNSEKYEFVGQIGFNGVELGAEGPFSKKHNSSYLVDYRYSTLAFFKLLGLNSIAGSSVPQYQDLTFKVSIPTKKAGRFMLFGIGGTSFIRIWDSEKSDDEYSYGLAGTDTDFGSDMGVTGLSHTYYFSKNTRLNTNIYLSGSRASTALDSLKGEDKIKSQYYRSRNSEVKYGISSNLTHKFSTRDILKTGIIFDRYNVSLLDSVYIWEDDTYFKNNDFKGSMNLMQLYGQWKHRITDKLNYTVGMHFQYFNMNRSFSPEPRAGLEWEFAPRQMLSFGYGLQAQTQPKVIYFVETELANGQTIQTNRDLNFTKSHQFVIAYNNRITENLRFKTEVYYQLLYNVPVSKSMLDYSVLNEGAYFYINLEDSLVNAGKGTNYGLELTFEKFLSNNFYFLGTASLFRSQYEGYNGEVHSTAFDNRYVFNALGGYEITLRKNKRLNIDLRGVLAGGKPYTPIDQQQSELENRPVYLFDQAFSKHHPDYFRLDVKVGFRMPMGKTSNEYILEIQNVTNRKNVFQQSWNPTSKSMKTEYQQALFPMFTYRIYF